MIGLERSVSRPDASGSNGRRTLAIAAAYLAVTLIWAWPLPLHLGNRFTHDPGDPLLVTFLIWWNAHAVPLTRAWWNAPFFWPLPDALALTEHFAGLSPFTTPVQLLGGSPLLAYNLILIASTWWSALATHALVRRLTGNTVAAACAAIAFAFAPYRTSQLGHLQLYACWWLPVSLLGLHAYLDTGRRRWLAVFGAAWLLQALTNGYMMFFLPVLYAAWIAWFTPWRTQPRKAIEMLAAWIFFSLPLLPVLLEYYRVQTRLGLARNLNEMVGYSASWSAFLSATPMLRFWHTPEPSTTETYLFPGLTIVAAIVCAAVARARGRTFAFYVGFTVLAVWLCGGPTTELWTWRALLHPYNALVWLPGFSGLRVPPRFFLLAALTLSIAGGLAVAHLNTLVRRRALWSAVLFAGLLVDGAIAGMPLGVPPGKLALTNGPGRVLALPFDDAHVTVRVMYQSMFSGMPVVNGYAGYIPPHADVIRWALIRHDPTILAELRRGLPLYVIVTTSDAAVAWTQFIGDQPGVEMLGVSGGGTVFKLPPTGFRQEVTPGPPLTALRVDVSGDALIVDLGEARVARWIDLRTFGYLTRLPKIVRVEASLDGAAWATVHEDWPGGAALAGALADPRIIPLRLLLPDVRARYLRVNTPRLGPRAVTIYAP